MTPYGYQQPPPVVGTCLRCHQVVQGPYVAFPSGPMHPACAHPPRKQSNAPLVVALIAGVIGLLGFVLFVVGAKNRKPATTTQGSEEAASGGSAAAREPKALCTKLREALGDGKCLESPKGYGLDVQGSVIVPQCRTESDYRALEPRKKEKEFVFVGSESSWCFAFIMNLRGQPVPESLITKTRAAVNTF